MTTEATLHVSYMQLNVITVIRIPDHPDVHVLSEALRTCIDCPAAPDRAGRELPYPCPWPCCFHTSSWHEFPEKGLLLTWKQQALNCPLP
ncbi:hypothetical protein ACLOJK_010319 [Asimina triloba]